MPYVKTKYVNGAIAYPDWTEQVIKYKPWYYDAIMPKTWQEQVITTTPYTNATAYFTGTKYEYFPSQKDKKQVQSNLSNYNDALEINSVRDIVLGTFNPNMKHSTWFGDSVAKTPILNIIPNTLQHAYKHYINPIVKGEPLILLNNALMGMNENLDVLANPVKALVISAWNEDDVSQALLRSTFGDETGIHNYEYDTGNKVYDILLEVVSDPLNWVSWFGKGAVKSTSKEALEKAVKSSDFTTKAGRQELAKELSQIYGKKVTVKQLEEAILRSGNKYSKKMSTALAWSKSDDVIKKGLLNKELQNELLNLGKTKYTKIFTRNLDDIVGATTKLSKLPLNDALNKAITKYITKINDSTFLDLSTNVINSLGYSALDLENTISKVLIKSELSLTGVYPAFKALKGGKTALSKYLYTRTMTKASNHQANEILNYADNFLKAGDYDGAFQVIENELDLRVHYSNLKNVEELKRISPEEIANYYATQFKLRVVKAKQVFNMADDISADVKERAILNIFQSLDSNTEIKSLNQVMDFIKQFEKEYAEDIGRSIMDTPFTELKKVISDMETQLKYLRKVDDAKNFLLKNKELIDLAKDVEALKTVNTANKYTVKQLIDMLPESRLYAAIQLFPTETAYKLINSKTIDIGSFSELTDELYLAIRYFTDNFDKLPDPDGFQYVLEIINNVRPLAYSNKVTPEYVEGIKDLISAVDIIKTRYTAKDYGKIIDPKYYDVLFPSVASKYISDARVRPINKALVEALEDVPDISAKQDLTQTRLFRDSYNLLKQATTNEDLVKKIPEQVKNFYSDVTTERVKQTTNLVKQIVEATGVEDTQASITLNHAIKDDLAQAIKQARSESNILSPFKRAEIDKNLKVLESYILDQLEDNDYLKGLYFNERFTIIEEFKKNLEDFKKLLYKMESASDKEYKIGYGEFTNSHHKLYLTLEKLKDYLKNLLRTDEPPITKHYEIQGEKQIGYYVDTATGGKLLDEAAIKETPLKEALDVIPSGPAREASKMLDDLENVLQTLNPEQYESKYVQLNYDTWYARMQLEKTFVQNNFNNLSTLQVMRQDPWLRSLTDNIINARSSAELDILFKAAGYNDATKSALISIAVTMQGADNATRALNLLDNFVNSLELPAKQKQMALAAAHTTWYYSRLKDIYNTSGEMMANEFSKHFENYMNAVDPTIKKKSMDKLIKDYAKARNVTPEVIQKEIIDTIKEIPDIDPKFATRHSALYDAVAQVKIYNQLHPDVPFYGYMLDTETTKLLDKYGRTNGHVTEIVAIFVDKDGTITAPFNKAIKASKETYENYYALTDNVLASLGTTSAEWSAKYITQTDEYLEKQLLYDFYEFLTNDLRQGIPTSTFNGDNFDWLFMCQRMKSELGIYDIAEQIAQIKPRDIYAELAKDHYKLTNIERARLAEIFTDIINTQRETLGKYKLYYNYPIKVSMGMDNRFIDDIKNLIDIDTLKKLNNVSVSDNLDDLLLLNGWQDDGELLDRFAEIIESSQNLGLFQDLIKADVDPQLKKYLLALCEEYVDLASKVKTVNQQLKDTLISSVGIDELNPRYNPAIKEKLNKLVLKYINDLPDSEYKSKILKDFTGVQNLTEVIALGSDTDPMIAYKKYSGEIFKLWDLTNYPLNGITIDRANDALTEIIRLNDNLYNVESIIPYKTEIAQMLEQIKASKLTIPIAAIKLDPENLQFSYAELDYFIHHLERTANSESISRLGAEKLVKQLKQAHPELYEFINDGTPYVRVSVEGNSLNFIKPSTVKWQKELNERAELLALKDFSKRNVSSMETLFENTDQMKQAMGECLSAGVLRQELIDTQLENAGRTTLKLYKEVGYQTTQTRLAYHLHNILMYNKDPDKLISEILYSNKDHVLTLLKPSNNAYFNNLDNFIAFKQNIESLKKAGIKVITDSDDRIILALDTNKLKITLNKNKGELARYCINDIPIEPNVIAPMSYDVYRSYVSGPAEYTKKMYDWLNTLENMNHEMSGRSGITNYFEQYEDFREMNTFGEYAYSTFIDGDTYMPFVNNAYVGEYNDLIKDVGPLQLDSLYLYSNASSKITTQLSKHVEYGKFIYESGLRLDSDVMQKMSPEHLTQWLNNNSNFVAVYLADANRAVGGFELRRISFFTPEILTQAKRLKATIIPYDQYVRAAGMINNYHYNNTFERILGKITTAYKRGFLLNVGVMVRNIIDSGMKNYIEGENIPETTMNYIKAMDLYQKYTKVMTDIQNMDVNKYYRLQNAIDYFSQNNRLLDYDTYHFIYNFMNENGMNVLHTTSNNIFDWAMKPMSYIEKINRLVQYLNLKDQGKEYSEIIRKIAETHFDYNLKTQADFITQIYIPFWTYASNNIDYIAHLIDEHPSFLRNYFNVYTPIWDFDSLNYEELAQNSSLQSQIANGNIPLSIFGYQDKEYTRQIQTKYGMQTQTMKNTATLKMGSSILDGLNFFLNPYEYITSKLAPPYQTIVDSVTGFACTAYGNQAQYSLQDYFSAEENYQRNFGSTTIPALFKDPSKLIDLIPGMGVLKQKYTHRDSSGQQVLGSSTGYRTQNELLGALPSVFGATSRWGTFTQKPRKTYAYPKKTYTYTRRAKYSSGSGSGRYKRYGRNYYYSRYVPKTYTLGRTPYSKYSRFLYNVARPDLMHKQIAQQRSGNMQTIPQYLYSYMGRTRRGKSKMRLWFNMDSRTRIKYVGKMYARS